MGNLDASLTAHESDGTPPMDNEYLFDATVLSAFAVVRRLDLLENRYAGRSGWVEAVHREILDGISDHPNLSAALSAPWLGEPLPCFAVNDVERVRRRLGGARWPLQHLGEAETIVVARERVAIVATDDRDARAIAEGEGVRVVTTPTILRAIVRDSHITSSDAAGILASMRAAGRWLPHLPENFFR